MLVNQRGGKGVPESRIGCCDDWPKPCTYHEGWADAADSLATEVERLKGALREVAEWEPLAHCPTCTSAALQSVQRLARAALSPSTDDQKGAVDGH